MSGFAWVTLATNDSYSLGALVLAHSLKQAGTAHQLAVLVTPGVTNVTRKNLADVFNVVEEVNLFDSKDEANLRLLKRPELGVTFTKLHCWRLTQFEKCVFLDADVLVLVNSDELFERDEFSAAPDVGWPDCFNSGVFVYRPSLDTYNKLVDFALQKGSFDGGDQGLLNAYFSDWAHKDISKHLPFIYNMCSTACYSYLPAFKYYGGNVKIVHFIGPAKPWLQYFDTESRVVHPSQDLQHLQEVLQRWWDIFCSLIHPKLTPDMAPSKQAAENLSHFQSHSYTHQTPVFQDFSISEIGQENNVYNVWDPWEEYEEQIIDENVKNDERTIPEVSTYNECASSENVHSDISNLNQINVQEHVPDENHTGYVFENNHQDVVVEQVSNETLEQPIKETETYIPHFASIVDNKLDKANEPIKDVSPVINTNPPSPSLPHTQSLTESLPNLCETSANNSQDASLHTKDNDDGADSTSQSGLAGAFAQFTLGVKRTAAQDALENHLRRQAWEVGNIDYMGRDSFDNIWSKICQTLSTTQLESVKDGAVFSSENQQVPEVPQEGSTAAPAESTEAPILTESPTEVKTQLPEEQVLKPDVVPDPEPRKEETPAVPPVEAVIEPAVLAETVAKDEVPAPQEEPQIKDIPAGAEPIKEVASSESVPPVSEAVQEVPPPVSEAVQEVPPPVSEAVQEVPPPVSEAVQEVLPPEPQAEQLKLEPEAIKPVEEVPPPAPESKPEAVTPVPEVIPPTSKPVAPVQEVLPPKSEPESVAPAQEVLPPKSEPLTLAQEVLPPKLEAVTPAQEVLPPKPEPEVVKPVQEAVPSEPEPKPELEPEPKPEPKSEPKAEPKSEPQPEPKPEPKSELKPELKPEPKSELKSEPKPELKPEPKSEPKEVLPPEPVKEVAPVEEAKPKPTKREAKAPKSPDNSKIAKTPKVETTIESPKAEAAPESPKTEVPPESPKAEAVPESPKPEDAPQAEASAEVPKSDTKPKEVRKVKKKVKKVPKPEGDASEGAPKK